MGIILVDGHPVEEAKADYPDRLYTWGLGPCLGIGILNHKTKKAYLGHYISHSDGPEELLRKAVKEADKGSDLEVALAGNMCPTRELIEDLGDDYDHVFKGNKEYTAHMLQLISSYGISKVQNKFHEEFQEGSYSILVDTKKLKIFVWLY